MSHELLTNCALEVIKSEIGVLYVHDYREGNEYALLLRRHDM